MTKQEKIELSEKNKRLIEDWDGKVKINNLNITVKNNEINDIDIGLLYSPFDNYISKGTLDLDLLPSSVRKLLKLVIKMLCYIIEKNINEGEKVKDGKKTNV